VVGTAHYLSPEQADGGKATPASDVYALCTVAYECLAGRRAFDGENAVQIALKQIREQPAPLPADVPAPIRAVVERAMAKDPAVRYADGAELRAAVEAAATVSPTVPVVPSVSAPTATFPAPTGTFPAPSASPAAPRTSMLPRRPWARVLVGLAAAFAVVAVLVGALAGPGGRSPVSGTAGTSSPRSTAPSSTPTPSSVDVVAADLVGRPLQDVQDELTARGLQVQAGPVETGDVAAGLVTAVTPEGALAPGSTVTLSYAVAPPAVVQSPAAPAGNAGGGKPDGGKPGGHGHGHGKN